jgi:hypothetical protein
MKRVFNPTERLGVAAVQTIFTEFGWIFREQQVADFGIDAQVEITEQKQPTGQLIALQIKTGSSYFRDFEGTIAFYTDDAHMRYWERHALPVIIVLHNPDTGETLWQWVDRSTAKETNNGWRIDIPRENVLSVSAKEALSNRSISNPEFERRQRFAADKNLMREFVGHDAFVVVNVWINKTWHIREIEIYLDDPAKEHPDFVIPVVVTSGYTVSDVMAHFFPWLEFTYIDEAEVFSEEVEEHKFEVTLTEAAKAYLLTERYFEQEVPGLFDTESSARK